MFKATVPYMGKELNWGLLKTTLCGAILIGALLPATTFALESGAERPLNSTGLPFLREASSGGMSQTIDYANGGGAGNKAGGTTNGVFVEPGGLVSQANQCRFRDIEGHTSEKAINYLYDRGVAGGRRPCYFDPNAAATRAEVAAMVVRAVEVSVPESPLPKAFPDTDVKAWSARHVKAAKNADIVHGYPDGLYRAEKPVNVVESLKIVTRGFKSDFSQVNLSQVDDITDIQLDQWYVKYVDAGLDEGIIDMDATQIYPASQVTRAEIAQMIYDVMIKRMK